MIKSYQQIKREKGKKKSLLQKVRRLLSFSRLNLENKISEWKLRRIREKALKAEGGQSIQGLTLAERVKAGFSRLSLECKGLMKKWKGKVVLRKGFALITIFAVIITAYFQNTPQAQAATFTLYQTAWNSVNASEAHNPTNNQTEIKTYSAKDTNLNIVDGGVNDDSLNLSTTSGTDTDTLEYHPDHYLELSRHIRMGEVLISLRTANLYEYTNRNKAFAM